MASKKKWRQRYYDAVQDYFCKDRLEVQELQARIRQKDEVIKQQTADFEALKKEVDALNLFTYKLQSELEKLTEHPIKEESNGQ